MRLNFVFSSADARQINEKMMAQKASSDMASQSTAPETSASEPATRQARSASIRFSVKEMNDAMTKARQLLTI